MKLILKTLMLLAIIVSGCSTAKQAENGAKKWLRAWDNSDLKKLQKHSVEGILPAFLEDLINTHNNEPLKNIWHLAKEWRIEKDTIEGMSGYIITPILPNDDNLPLFVRKDNNGKWRVDPYYSEIEIPDPEEPDEEKSKTNDY